jgi:hypothetical protein
MRTLSGARKEKRHLGEERGIYAASPQESLRSEEKIWNSPGKFDR